MAELDRTNAFIVLNGLPNIGPITLRRLLDAFNGDPVAIFEAPASHLKSVKGVGDAVVDTLRNWTSHLNLEKQLQRMEKGGIRFVVTQSDDYPPLLKEIYDPPIGLYWKGDYVLDRPTVAIVGSRRTTVYGRHVARKLGRELAHFPAVAELVDLQRLAQDVGEEPRGGLVRRPRAHADRGQPDADDADDADARHARR